MFRTVHPETQLSRTLLVSWCSSCCYGCGSCFRHQLQYLVQQLLLQLWLLFLSLTQPSCLPVRAASATAMAYVLELTQVFANDVSCLPGTAVAVTAAATDPGTDPAVQQGSQLLTWYSCCCYSCGLCSGHWPSCSPRMLAAYLVQLLLLQLRLLFRALTQLFTKDVSCLPGTAVAATAAASVPGTEPAV